MNEAYLLIGGNIGDRVAHLSRAKEAIAAQCGTIRNMSFVYETAAWGINDQPAFLNQALMLATVLQPAGLLENILRIEQALGRMRTERYGPRLIDIDILLFNDAVVDLPGLKVPHPQLQHRRFALQCLADIAAQVIHPVLGLTIGQLLDACTDKLEVHKFP